MIVLSPVAAIMVYLLATLAALLTLWGFRHYQGRKKKMDLSHQKLVVCEYCGFAFLGALVRPVAQCPQCRSYVDILTRQKEGDSNI